MADRVGQQLGNYQLLRLLGEGGFAEVYLGEHIHLGTQAAIKVLHTQLTSDDVDRFRTEARTIAHLIHPHIVRVLEFGVEGKTPFLVMDYAANGSLRQRHPKGVVLPLPLIVAYVKQVADALQYAHDEKLIHRDIKPENMLLGRRNDILLSDFGIALVAQSSRYQSMQDMAGTMAYMAPEQIQGKPRPASDQYSLGIVVYEWISGDRPFHGSLTELVGQHLSAPPPPLREKLPKFSPAVEEIVLMALAKDPKQRFSSVQAFATALEQSNQVTTVPSVTLPIEVSNLKQILLPDNTDAAISSNQSALSMEVFAPPNQSLQTTNFVTPQSQPQPSVTKTPSSASSPVKAYLHAQRERAISVSKSPSAKETVPPSKSASEKANINSQRGFIGVRRVILIGIALLILASSIGLYSIIRGSQILADNARMNTTATARVATDIVNTATSSSILTVTAEANVTATANTAATATSYVVNVDPYPPTGRFVYSDPLQFDNGEHMWNGSSMNADACAFKGGALHAFSQSGYGFCVDGLEQFSNLAFEVQMKIMQGNCGGITVRSNIDSGEYSARICQDGTYALILSPIKNNVGLPDVYLATGSSSQIHTGVNQAYLIALIAINNALTLYVNHHKIASASDNTTSSGVIGMFAAVVTNGQYSSNSPCDAAFSNARVWAL